MVAYTHARARDVQSFGSSTHISNWQFGRTLAGDQLSPYRGISLFDQTHKLTATGTYTKKLDGRLEHGLHRDLFRRVRLAA